MSKQLIKTSIVVTIVMIIGYIISFAKEAVIANYFGVSDVVDAYTIAIQIPVLLFSFVSVAVQSVVIPVYSDILYNHDKNESRNYLNNLLTILILITLGIVLAGELFADFLTYIFAPGFSSETHSLSTELLRLTFPSIIFSVVCQVLIAVLNVHKNYVINSFSVYILNVGVIVSICLLRLKVGITSACIGQLVGEFGKCVFVVVLARRFYHFSPQLGLRNVFVIKTLKSSLPVLWSISIAEINAIVNRMVGSFLFVGSISALAYSGKINTVLQQLFVSAIATIVYPLYAESAAKHDSEQLNNRVNLTFSAYAMSIIPLMIALIILKKEVIQVAFARGSFDQNAVELTQILLGCFAIGMLFMSLRSTLTNVFYSLNDTKTPAVNATLAAILNIGLNLILPLFLGVYGIAIASSITAAFVTIRLLYVLTKKYNALHLSYFYSNLYKIVIASVLMGTVIIILRSAIILLPPLYILSICTIVGIAVYLVISWCINIPVIKFIVKKIKSK